MPDKTRFNRGKEKLNQVDGNAGEQITDKLGDLGRYIVEFAFGDIYCREGLALRDREIASIAMLSAMGGKEPQLKVHINAGLNVGLSKTEIEEIIIQSAVYAGFPAAINALNILKEVQ